MAVNVGTLEIQLRAQIANLQTDLGRANQMLVNTQQTMTTGFRQASEESRHHLMLLEDAIGVRLPLAANRMIVGVPAIAAAVNTAFATVGVVAFAAIIIERVIPAIEKVIEYFTHAKAAAKEAADAAKTYSNEISKAMLIVGTEQNKLPGELALVGQTGSNRTGIELQNMAREIDEATAKIATARDGLWGLQHGMEGITHTTDDYNKMLMEGTLALTHFTDQQTLLNAVLKSEMADEAAAHLKMLQEAAAKLNAELFKTRQVARTAFDALQLAPVGNVIGTASDLQSQRTGPTYASTFGTRIDVQNEESLRQATDAYNATRTAAELYNQTIIDLNDLLSKGVISQDTFNRTVIQAKNSLDIDTIAMHQFGMEAGRAFEQGALMGRSWSDVLQSLTVDVINLIAKMTILKNINASSGGAAGFFGSLLTGFFGGGRAGGGDVSSGTSYLVGEQGPEVFTPGSNGLITPNGGFGSTINIDARGADAGVEYRIKRALAITEERAVQRAVLSMRDLSSRM